MVRNGVNKVMTYRNVCKVAGRSSASHLVKLRTVLLMVKHENLTVAGIRLYRPLSNFGLVIRVKDGLEVTFVLEVTGQNGLTFEGT